MKITKNPNISPSYYDSYPKLEPKYDPSHLLIHLFPISNLYPSLTHIKPHKNVTHYSIMDSLLMMALRENY